MKSRGQLEIAKPGNSSWMPYVPQEVTGLDDDDDDDDETITPLFIRLFPACVKTPLKLDEKKKIGNF